MDAISEDVALVVVDWRAIFRCATVASSWDRLRRSVWFTRSGVPWRTHATKLRASSMAFSTTVRAMPLKRFPLQLFRVLRRSSVNLLSRLV